MAAPASLPASLPDSLSDPLPVTLEPSFATQAAGDDLRACNAEPIRVPGAIQPHGRLLVFDAAMPGAELVARSDNWSDGDIGLVRDRLVSGLPASLAAHDAPTLLGGLLLGDAGPAEIAVHHNGRFLIVDCEMQSVRAQGLGNEAPIYSLGRNFLPRLQQTHDVAELLQLAAVEIKRLTGFGRCLVYRFDEAGHGEVLAEALDPGYASYAGHHFPAADIPSQAKALYLRNHFRIIPDANYRPVALRCLRAGLAATDIDLSMSSLRSVSPIHLEYMRNMGTLASMSVSIVIEGRLWGLISCHHHDPRSIDMPTRLACEHLGHLLSLQIQSKFATQQVAERLELRKLTMEIVAHLAHGDSTLRGLVSEAALMLRLARATGAAVVLDEQVWTAGDVPARGRILALVGWIAGHGQAVFHSSRVIDVFGPAAADPETAAGVLAVSISQLHRHWIVWFRPEVLKTVTWAGDPRKSAPSASGRMHPRLSFQSWVEHVRGRSLAWSASEIGAVTELRQALIGIVLRRAEELAEVATELGRVNKELEAFSYTVSHDLRAPMRHIAGYVDLVVDGQGDVLTERSRRYLGQVKEAAAFAGQMVDALLDFSRMGRSELKVRQVDVGSLVASLVAELRRVDPSRRIDWRIEPDLPTLTADPLLLQVAMRNLLSNAVKYSRGRDPGIITVRSARRGVMPGIEVEDNGVGFKMAYVDRLFGVFQRLHQADEFEGTGIGLANVRRIVERHGGVVWARGEPDCGAVFGLALPEPKGAAGAGMDQSRISRQSRS